ncbi:MAG: 30S ribosomal protein S3 [Alphaproteobacteria bacterium]|nr:30S ribosomal protein S3 [Alphaproteobacteria bacterium]MBN2780213.1 30S ribosomal protein S3 [Alphaproteobacteria bacterium]
MGQKTNPIGLRVGVKGTDRRWDSQWFANKGYGDQLLEDFKIRSYVEKTLKSAGIARILIERPAKRAHVTIFSSRPGIIIGKKGEDIEKLKKKLQSMTSSELVLNIKEVRRPDLDATLAAWNVAQQLERRVSFRRAMKRMMENAFRAGAKGVRVAVAGRLNGAEIARTEWYLEGQVPLHTLRADIDYGTANALTAYGIIGVKVWIYRGEFASQDKKEEAKKVA